MKIGYITVSDILNKSTWSREQQGLCAAGYNIAKQLEKHNYVDYLGPLSKRYSVITRAKWSMYRYLFQKDYYRWAEPLVTKDYASQIEGKLFSLNLDIVLCPENIVSIANLQCKQPIVLWTDATLSSLIDFYRHMNNLCHETIKNIYILEAEALNRCDLIIYTSTWAAQTAIDTYSITPSKIKVIPWGPNLACSRTWEEINVILDSKDSSFCKLLFIGVDWVRKGGNKALEIAQKLNKLGLKTELIVVGCQPKVIHSKLPDCIRFIEFIDKSTVSGLKTLETLFTTAHFLILPTLADCTPHVFSEANSFGVPCLSTNVGGITTIIQDGLNGKTFSTEASTDDYCQYILSLMTNYSNYKELALSSFEQYCSRLNWEVTVSSAEKLMMNLI